MKKTTLALIGSLIVSLLGCNAVYDMNMASHQSKLDGFAQIPDYQIQNQAFNREQYDHFKDSGFLSTTHYPLSTFSADVDTASYANTRRFINSMQLPPKGAVRAEEMINYFDYGYKAPENGENFAAHFALTECPWSKGHSLLRIGLKGKVSKSKRLPMNLTFLIDVSGSMGSPNKLPLVKNGLEKIVKQMNENDRIAIVVYAGSSGLALPSTSGKEKEKILNAIGDLASGGSTNGGEGIKLAYFTNEGNFLKEGVNRVILCTDGDFNVGISNQSQLIELIKKKAQNGIFLSVFGFGTGNYNDSMLYKLADNGNGNYGYIDTAKEAQRQMVDRMRSNFVAIAKDVKLQVEFNPSKVKAYRLIGYEKRELRDEDFNDDKKDAGEIGEGHEVTVLYELIPSSSDEKVASNNIKKLKYQKEKAETGNIESNEICTLSLRYKVPDGSKSLLKEFPVKSQMKEWDKTPANLRFAASVAGFSMILRDSPAKGNCKLTDIIEWAEKSKGDDEVKNAFVKLVRKTRSLKN